MTELLACALVTLAAGRAEPPLSLLGRYDLVCPVCTQVFTTVVCTQSNTRGGIDRDLFARAVGPQPEFYRISTCPKCGYSGYESDFAADVGIPPDVRERILVAPRLTLPDGFGPSSNPRELDASDRYALAITCYEWRGKSDEALAWLHLRASWVARESGAILPPDSRLARVMAFIERWRPPLQTGANQLDVEMKTAARVGEAIASGAFNRYQRPYVELALALILRRHGENRQAAPLLDRLTDVGREHFSEELLSAARRMRSSIDHEQACQARAAACFERALLAEQVPPANRPAACYLLGELLRRLGRDAEALHWLDQGIRTRGLPPDLLTWAREQRVWAAAEN